MTKKMMFTLITLLMFITSVSFAQDGSFSQSCEVKRAAESCSDTYYRFEAIIPVFDVASAIYQLSPYSCFNRRNDVCDISPDIRKICGCLAARNGTPEPVTSNIKTDNQDEVFPVDKDVIKNLVKDETTELLINQNKELENNGCPGTAKAKPDLNQQAISKCDEIENKIKSATNRAKKTFSNSKGSSDMNRNIASVGAQKPGTIEGPMGVVPTNLVGFHQSCMSFNDFNADYEIPSEPVLLFFNEKNETVEKARARGIIVMSAMKGEPIYPDSVEENTIDQYLQVNGLGKKADETAKIKAEVVAILKSDKYKAAKEDLKIFASNNSYWAELLKNDPKKTIKKFQEIYHRQKPIEILKKLKDMEKTNDVIASKGIVSEKNSKLLEDIFNEQTGLMQRYKIRLFSDFDLVNQKIERESPEKYSPGYCATSFGTLDPENQSSMFEEMDSSQGQVAIASTRGINEKVLEGCKTTYADICSRIGTVDEFNQAPKLDPEDKDKLLKGIDYIQNKKKTLEKRAAAYHEFQERICAPSSKHQLDSSYGFGNKAVNRDEFKKELCEKKNKRLVKMVPEGVTLDKVCADTPEGATLVTSIYANGIEDDSEVPLAGLVAAKKATNADSRKEKEEENRITEYVEGTLNDGGSADYPDKKCGFTCSLRKSEAAKAASAVGSANSPTSSPTSNPGSGPSFVEQFASSFSKAAESITQPAIDNNVQSYLNGNIPASSILPASFANADAAQISGAKSSVDNSIAQLEKKIDNYEKSNSKAAASSQNEELELLRKQIAELKQQSESLKSQLEKEKENKVAEKSEDQNAVSSNVSRSVASSDYKGINPQVSGATQATMNQNSNPSKVYENMFADGSFHSVPTIGSSKSIDSKAFTSRSSNDALLSIYTDKGVSSLVDAVATTSNSNILVVGNALEMQETTVKDKKFQTKELVVDQKRLEMIRSNPDSLRSLIEENKIKNHVGILTLKNGENQLNYIMRKDDSGKVVILPLNIARRVTLDSLKNELIRN